MVVFVVVIHPITNIFLGFLSTGLSFFTSFKLTTQCLKRCHPLSNQYQSITINNKIIIDDQDSESENITLENTIKFKKKVNFNNVIHFRSIPNKDESPKSEIWYGNKDYVEFKEQEMTRRKQEYNLQEMMAQVEENKHLNKLLEAMQEKEHQQELERKKEENI